MNKHLYILLALALTLASCSTTRRSTSNSQQHSDTTTRKADSIVTVYRERIIRDTVITIAERTIRDTVTLESPCKPRAFYREKTANGLKAWVGMDNDGNLGYGCNADSFVIVIRNLVRERDSFNGLYRQQQFINRVANSTSEVVKEKRTFAGWVLKNLWWIAAIVILLIIISRSIAKMLL